MQNRYLNHLVDLRFQGLNRLFVLSFENEDDTTSRSTYYLSKVEIKDCNVSIDGKNLISSEPINSELKANENITRIATGQGDYYTTSCLLNYSYFKDYYNMFAINLSKQQIFDADPRATQYGSQGTVKVLWMQFHEIQLRWIIWFLSA